MRNSLIEDINRLKITYEDNNFIFFPVLVLAGIEFALYFSFGFYIALLVALPLSLLVILAVLFHLYRGTEAHLENERRQNQALIALHNFLDLRMPLHSMAGWSAHPELAITIVEYIRLLKPGFIVEAGSGVSSVISCYCLENNKKGYIQSLDHSREYCNKTNLHLNRHALSDWGDVAFAPLQNYTIDGESWQWYDFNCLNRDRKIDMLIIDGPPLETQKKSRYPAVPLLYDQLSDTAVIILDDAARKSESEVVNAWLKKYPEFSLEYIRSQKGIAILSRNL